MSESSSHTTSALQVGMVLGNWLPPEGIGRASRAVEQAGFDELWLAEDCFYAGGIAAASAALTSTDHIPVGVGIFSCMVRHPALLAMELSALARSHPGRFRPGIGLGLAEFLQHMDLLPRSPLSAVRTVVRDVRRLLAGERVTSDDGPFSLTDVELAHHCRESRVPVLIGGMGPKMLRLGGELGDGVVLSILSHASYVSWAVEQIAVGAAAPSAVSAAKCSAVTVFALCSIDENRDVARSDAVELLSAFLILLRNTEMIRQLDISDAIDRWHREGPDAVAAHLADDLLDELVIWGTPEDCAGQIRRLATAGADAVALFPSQLRTAQAIELGGRRLLPLLHTG